MAFTERQPLTDGTNRVIDDPANPSPIPGILGVLSGSLDSYVNYRQEVAKDRAAKKAEEEKVRKQQAQAGVVNALYAAQDDVVGAAGASARGAQQAAQIDSQMGSDLLNSVGMAGIETFGLDEKTGAVFSTGTADLNPIVERKTSQAVGDITNFMAAVDQGRMPPISLKSAINGRIRKLFEEYPDQAEHILDMISKTGAKDVVFSEVGDIVAEIEGRRTSAQNQREDDRQFTQSMFEVGMKGLGELAAIGGVNGGPMTREEIVAAGMRYTRQATELDLASRQAQLSLTNANISAEQRKEAEAVLQQDIVRILSGDIHNDAIPIIQMSQQLAASLATDPTGADAPRWEQLGVMANNAVNNWVENAVQIAVQRGYKGDVNSLRNQFHGQFKGLLDNFTGDLSVASANNRALKTMQDKMGINVQQALPVFQALRAAGLNPNDMPGLMEGVARNPEMQKALRNEIQGFIPEFGSERASTRLMNIIKILRSEATLRDMAPDESRQLLPTLYGIALESAKGYNRGLGVSPDTILSSIGEVAIATRTLGPSSGSGANGIAAAGLSDPNVRQSLLKLANDPNADKVMVTATAQAVRAGNAVVLNNVQANVGKINQQLGTYFELKWDDRNGRYYIDDTKKKQAYWAARKRGNTPIGGAAAPVGVAVRTNANTGPSHVQIYNMKAPEEMERWMKAANLSLDNIIELGSIDPTTPKGSAIELRRFYGRGAPLKSQQNDDIVPAKERATMFDKLEKGLQGIQPDVVDVPPARSNASGRADFASNPAYKTYAPTVQRVATQYNIPTEVMASLLQFESSFNPNAEGPVITKGSHKGDRALGMGQVMAKTAAKYLSRFGVTDRRQLSPEQQIELAAMVLADNKAAGGTWQDAVSRYFTGVDFNRAQREGRTDGYTDVFTYVRGIAG